MKKFIAALVALVAMATAVAGPASAARQINPPAWFVCNKYAAKISISPPRIWATRGTEKVVWLIAIERWNSTSKSWYKYYNNPFQLWSSFNYYGQSMTSWVPQTNTGLSYYANNTLNLPVKHVGYYRVASVVRSLGGGTSAQYIGGRNNNCYVR
jgi:hypothetical protein